MCFQHFSHDTPQNRYEAAYATAYAAWIAGVRAEFVTYATQNAQADADLTVALAQAREYQSNRQAEAEVAYVAARGPLAATQSVDTVTAREGYSAGLVGRENAWAMQVAEADQQHGLDLAQALKKHAVDRATAEKDYQLAKLNDVATADADHVLALANADLDQVKGEADADRKWTKKLAEAEKGFADAEAPKLQELDEQLAEIDLTYVSSIAEQTLTRRDAYAEAGTGRFQREQDGKIDQQLDQAEATADWLSAKYTDAAAVLDPFAATLGTPWAQYQSDLAQAKARAVSQGV